jgi:TPR repeat protein
VVLTEPRLSAAESAALVARGDAFLGVRDIASARLFYERAVEAGDGRAALRMGATFDPAFLDRANIRGVSGNQQEALSWYRRARDLGESGAERLLKASKTQ